MTLWLIRESNGHVSRWIGPCVRLGELAVPRGWLSVESNSIRQQLRPQLPAAAAGRLVGV